VISDETISWSVKKRRKKSFDFEEPGRWNRPYQINWVIDLTGPDGKKYVISRRLIQKILKEFKLRRSAPSEQEPPQEVSRRKGPLRPPPRVGIPDNVEYHSVCGKPLARSIEELERFKAIPVTWEFEGIRWYCDCGMPEP
jgi:hypothetical protein